MEAKVPRGHKSARSQGQGRVVGRVKSNFPGASDAGVM